MTVGKWTIASLVALACLLTATEAGAAQVEYVTGTGSAGPNSLGEASATCPTFDYPSGGGIFSSGDFVESYVTALELDSDPIRDTFQGWSWGYEDVVLNMNVACVDHKLTYKTKQREIGSGETKTLTPHCPAGSKVVGGEVTHTAPAKGPVVHVFRPAEKNTAWEAELINITLDSHTMFATAACASGKFAKKLVHRHDTGRAKNGELGLVTTDCPQGTSALSGGVKVNSFASNVNSTGISSIGTGSSSYVDGRTRFTNYVVCVE
jgi:hypothetical protein